MIRQILLIALGLACAGSARAEMPQELVELLARPEASPTARAEVEAGNAPVWVFERDTGAEQVTVVGMVELPKSPQRISDDFFARDSLLEADIPKIAGAFSEPAVLGDVADYRVPESDLEVLADCEIHACKFKLGERALKDLEAIDWNAPDAKKVRGTRDRLHWTVRDYGYRPVTSIVHTVSFDPEVGSPARIIAAETLYSSHYF